MRRTLLIGAVSALAFTSTATATATAATSAEGDDGKITLCAMGPAALRLYADGPVLRIATLKSKCRTWKVPAGQYAVDGGLNKASEDGPCFSEVTVIRGKRAYTTNGGALTNVTANKKTVVWVSCVAPPVFHSPA